MDNREMRSVREGYPKYNPDSKLMRMLDRGVPIEDARTHLDRIEAATEDIMSELQN